MFLPHVVILCIICFITVATAVVLRAYLYTYAKGRMHTKIVEDVRTRKRSASILVCKRTLPLPTPVTTVDGVTHTAMQKIVLDYEYVGFIGSNGLFYSTDEVIKNDRCT